MQGSTKIPITDLTDYITCKICNGYFVDASTIIECLHTFCRSCIVKYLQKNKYCPVCDVQVHKSKPLLNIRPDKTLQDIVYKLVPRLFQNEMQRRRQFYENHPEAKPSSLEQCGEAAYQYLLTPEETICLTLSYHGADNKPRYLRCPAAVTMGHLKKLIRAKYDLSENHRVDILYNQDCLNTSLTLMDIAYIYLWNRKGPIELTYRIYENTAKKIKLEQPENVDLNNSVNISNNNNWKEVQLRISENGEMSITGIQDSLSPDLLEIVNSEPKYKNEDEDTKVSTKQLFKKELPGLKYIGKVNPLVPVSSVLDPLPVDTLNSLTMTVANLSSSPPSTSFVITNPSFSSPSSTCATLSSGSTTMVFSTINTTKCSTKTEETTVEICKSEENILKATVDDDKTVKRKLDSSPEVEPPAKQPKPIILNHNIGLLNLSNNHPLKKHSKFNRNGENVRDLPKHESDNTKSTEVKPNGADGINNDTSKKIEVFVPKYKITHKLTRPITPTSPSKPLAMRAKTLISETGVKPPCYQPRTVYNTLNNAPKPLTSLNPETSISVASKPEVRPSPVVPARTAAPQKLEKPIITTSATHTSSKFNINVSQAQSNKTGTVTQIFTGKILSGSPSPLQKSTILNSSINSDTQLAQSSLNGNTKLLNTSAAHTPQNLTQGTTTTTTTKTPTITNKTPASSPSQESHSIKPTTPSSTNTTSSLLNQNQNAINKNSNCTSPSIKSKPNTPIGYKTLRDPPKSWNSQISKANLNKSSPDPKFSDLKSVRPAKFFKMRNNMPRYLGNPASGVKPMYQVHVNPEKDKAVDSSKPEKSEIKKHSIVKIDPKTLKPISEKAPETTSLSNHQTTSNLNTQIYSNPNPNPLSSTSPTSNSALNDLIINTSSVSIFNPLKLQSSPKNEKKSPKSPHSPKLKTTTSPTGNKRENKITRNFTPPNPFIPNLPTKATLSPNQFIYPSIPPGFPTYDPRLMAAYYNQWPLFGQRMPFQTAGLPGINLDLNQRKGLEILTSPSSPKMDTLAQSILNHQISPRPIPPSSSNISPLQRNHTSIPLSPTITKSPLISKKTSKDSKHDKSLETVVEKMTQNRNRITISNKNLNKPVQDTINKSENPCVDLTLVDEQDNNSDNNIKKNPDQKLNKIKENDNSGSNQLLKIVTSNTITNVEKSSDVEQKIDTKPELPKIEQKESIDTKSEISVPPQEQTVKESETPLTDQKSHKPTIKETPTNSETPIKSETPSTPNLITEKLIEKENSNTQNTIHCENKTKQSDLKTKDEKTVTEDKVQVEIKEKE